MTVSSVARMLAIFDVEPVPSSAAADAPTRFTGTSDGGGRGMVDGSQVVAQSLVAAGKSQPTKAIRSGHAVLVGMVRADEPIVFDVAVVHAGRSFATTVVTASQGGRACVTTTVLLDTPTDDVIRHDAAIPTSTGPADAIRCEMPMTGRELRLVDVLDPNDPDDVGPPVLDAWLHYEPIPTRRDLAVALLAHFTGHLSISTTMRPHPGVGTAMAHDTLSTAPIAIGVTFHEPVTWDGWLLYHHESTQVGAGMSYVRGQVFTEDGRLVASFEQSAMIRAFAASGPVDRPIADRL